MEKASRAAAGFSVRPTPREILNRVFSKSLLGYNVSEVEGFLDEMARLAEISIRAEKESQDKIQALNEELSRWRAREAELVKLREEAQAEADKLRSDAERDVKEMFEQVDCRANEVRARTEQWLEQVIDGVKETQRRRTNFITAFRSALDSHYQLLSADVEPEENLEVKLSEFLSGAEQQDNTQTRI